MDVKKRDSNLELLRIIAMLFVLMVHASFRALDAPTEEDIAVAPLSSFLRFFSESVSIVCVNVFILITGWFGIRPKVLRFCSLIFQVLFIGVIVYMILLFLGKTELWGLSEWIKLLSLRRGLWFVDAYLVLYILSPVLNAFTETVSRNTFKSFLCAFFAVQTILGFHDFHNSGNFFCNGYTPLSFAGLYLLARYLRLYPVKLSTLNKLYDIAIYLCTVLATTFLSMVLVGQTGMNGWNLYSYLSPLVILSSLYFFLFFTKLSFYSKSINWIASSAFAVYLLHCDPLFFDTHYLAPIKRWYINDTMLVFLLHTSILIIALFGGALLVDRIRIILWNKCLILYKQFGGKHN